MIYLDYNATTPVAESVLDEMLPAFTGHFGNPSNTHHSAGRRACALVDQARERVAAPFGANPTRVIFTAGATESLNLAIKGVKLPSGRTRILVGATEHKAVLEAGAARRDAQVESVAVLSDGTLDLNAFAAALADDVALVAVMAVNNETGVIHPVQEAFDLARECGALTLCDATQAVGRIGLQDLSSLDFVALSAHKIHGPKGVGCLIGSRDGLAALTAIASGGGQERGLRSGTLNVPGIVGLGAAVEYATTDISVQVQNSTRLRDKLHFELDSRLFGTYLNGNADSRACNVLNLRFDDADGEAILANLQEVAAATGSACQSAIPVPSHVLRAMGLTPTEAEQSLRFSLGRYTTDEEIDAAVEDIVSAVGRVRDASPSVKRHT